MLHILEVPGVTRVIRTSSDEPIRECRGPVIDKNCDQVCVTCRSSIRVGKIPRFALCNGLWLGEVPPELKDLTFYEKMLISRVRHSKCFVRVRKGASNSTGHSKLVSNVISFENPTPKIYNVLPPPKEELEEVLAIMFSGNAQPTDTEYRRSLVFVRRNVVANAIKYCILNHSDYADVSFSHENLMSYSEDSPIVAIEYFQKNNNRVGEGISVHDDLEDDGIDNGDCVFTVHGIVGEDLQHMTAEAQKARALQHLDDGGKFMRTSHSNKPESIYNNPHLYPKMFPWLFPFGLGGIGSSRLSSASLSDEKHKSLLMLYHDKRFQTDLSFPFVAFSHEQVKAATTQSYLVANSRKFEDITSRLLSVNKDTLNDLATRMAAGEFVTPSSDGEMACFDLIRDINYSSSKVKGSISSKKNMQHEIWSLITHVGGPSWYFTLAPCDMKHPICMYFADTNESFNVPLRSSAERRRLLSQNPAAGARFFHFMVTLFLDILVGTKTTNPGIFGPTSAYYCTVEQQGRLTLHLHGLIFSNKTISPLEMKNHLLDPTSKFQIQLIDYIESIRQGEFISGDKEFVKSIVSHAESSDNYISPELTLPIPPPLQCHCGVSSCKLCEEYSDWLKNYRFTIDDLLLKSNLHDFSCLNNKYKRCKARFPRETHQSSHVDSSTGHLFLKKLEPWLNDISPPLTYLIRGNTDVTCLLSGTAIKAAVAYVTDYITKPGLKTHVVFDSLRVIFEKNTDILHGVQTDKDKSRTLMTKMVNLLATKLELGSPMICMYLLQNPDHYTSHTFIPFYWVTFVSEARKFWYPNVESEDTRVLLIKRNNKYIGLSSTFDYTHRPNEHHGYTLYDWVSTFTRVKLRPISDQLSFIEGHPLASTHRVQKFRNTEYTIPNFVGPPLPRSDKEDREYYCCTMLVLFKPWCTGADLKQPDQSWHEAFTSYQFSESAMLHIKNMNLRYECLDSRDDFRSQLKAGNTSILPHSIPFDLESIRDQLYNSLHSGQPTLENEIIDDENDDTIVLFDMTTGMQKGKFFLARERAMKTMRDILLSTGWTKTITTNLKDLYCGTSFDLFNSFQIPLRSSDDWSNIIKLMRQQLLLQRKYNNGMNNSQKSITIDSQSNTTVTSSFKPNVVEICDKGYFERLGIEYGSIREYTNSIVLEFNLNSEQERAFRIIAQHSVGSCIEPLRMYIGGMGGTGKSQVIKAILKLFTLQERRYAIVVVAPTGNAAALLGGSTYHYLLGINGKFEETPISTMSEVASRLLGIEYVVLDEVSMVSCLEMYRISERISK
ncbi:hypothetical protein F5880DRAFT_1487394, partial [Lentinula raphanica]